MEQHFSASRGLSGSSTDRRPIQIETLPAQQVAAIASLWELSADHRLWNRLGEQANPADDAVQTGVSQRIKMKL